MSDTVSATTGWAPGDAVLSFVTPSSPAAPFGGLDDRGNFHVPGGNQTNAVEPGLIVQFTTITPDFAGLLPDVLPQTSDLGTVGYAVTVPSGPMSVIVEFQTRGPGDPLGDPLG
jgi:hypothetical protein